MSRQKIMVGDRPGQLHARTVPNVHGSARAACEAWLAGSLWGNPIRVGPDRFHVYGCHLPDWSRVNVEFGPDHILVARSILAPAA